MLAALPFSHTNNTAYTATDGGVITKNRKNQQFVVLITIIRGMNMVDVFISYKRSDRVKVEKIAIALQRAWIKRLV